MSRFIYQKQKNLALLFENVEIKEKKTERERERDAILAMAKPNSEGED